MMTLCTRCQRELENVYFHNNLPYGSECINVITGKRQTSVEKKSQYVKTTWIGKDGKRKDGSDIVYRYYLAKTGKYTPLFLTKWLHAVNNGLVDGEFIYVTKKMFNSK